MPRSPGLVCGPFSRWGRAGRKKGGFSLKLIETGKAPAAIGPYSQGWVAAGLVFTSGQIPIDPATGAAPEGITAQAEQS